jgi:hypothetical protein
MTAHDPDRPIDLRLTRAELELVRVALRHLLASEDDPETITELKVLIERLAREAGRDLD